jgi:hypothetical protein
MNVLSFEKRERPPARDWRPEGSEPFYYDILIDELPLSEHLISAGRSNGFEPETTERGPEFLFPAYVDGVSTDNVGFFNYLSPAGWTRLAWQRSWVDWLKREAESDLPEHRIPVLVCGYCGSCCATTALVERSEPGVRWFAFQEYDWDFERLRLPGLYAGLDFSFDPAQYDSTFDDLLHQVTVDKSGS